MEASRDQLAAALAARQDTGGDAFAMTIDGTRHTARGDADTALRRFIEQGANGLRSTSRQLGQIGTLGGLPVTAEMYQLGQHPAEVSYTVGVEDNAVKIALRDLPNTKISTKLENALDRLDRLHADAITDIDKTYAEVQRAHERLGEPFPHTDELKAAREHLVDIEDQIAQQSRPSNTSEVIRPPEPAPAFPTGEAAEQPDRSTSGTNLSSRSHALVRQVFAAHNTDQDRHPDHTGIANGHSEGAPRHVEIEL